MVAQLNSKIRLYKRFSVFEPFIACLASNFEKRTTLTPKFVFLTNQKRYQKTHNFTLILNPLKKFKKMYKKSYKQKCDENMHFSTFTHLRQTCFAYNFFLVHFFKTFQRISNQHEILRF